MTRCRRWTQARAYSIITFECRGDTELAEESIGFPGQSQRELESQIEGDERKKKKRIKRRREGKKFGRPARYFSDSTSHPILFPWPRMPTPGRSLPSSTICEWSAGPRS